VTTPSLAITLTQSGGQVGFGDRSYPSCGRGKSGLHGKPPGAVEGGLAGHLELGVGRGPAPTNRSHSCANERSDQRQESRKNLNPRPAYRTRIQKLQTWGWPRGALPPLRARWSPSRIRRVARVAELMRSALGGGHDESKQARTDLYAAPEEGVRFRNGVPVTLMTPVEESSGTDAESSRNPSTPKGTALLSSKT
jgi:hypothetical protein